MLSQREDTSVIILPFLESPKQNADKVTLDTLFKVEELIETEFDKFKRTNEELDRKVKVLTSGNSITDGDEYACLSKATTTLITRGKRIFEYSYEITK